MERPIAIPRGAIEDTRLSVQARFLYILILKAAEKDQHLGTVTSFKAAAADMNLGMTQVYRYLQELRVAGLVSTKRRGQGKENLYTIHMPAEKGA